ncbi:Sec63 Brl domain-containing protein [Melampsora americana]|nr:Sec63 Brl domain-containing protein [Melampsora americana]
MDEDFENLAKEFGIFPGQDPFGSALPLRPYSPMARGPYIQAVDHNYENGQHAGFEAEDEYGIDEYDFSEAAHDYHGEDYHYDNRIGAHTGPESSRFGNLPSGPSLHLTNSQRDRMLEHRQPTESGSPIPSYNQDRDFGGRHPHIPAVNRDTGYPESRNTTAVTREQEPSVRLIPVSKLPEPYKKIFPFQSFNLIQSKILPTVYESEANVVVTAPTGSGKTVVFELGILRMLEYDSSAKAVYMAPTKSLCSERFQDWTTKLATLGVKCIELTGDSEFSSLKDAKIANVIITTPEKWDSMTRKWFDYPKILSVLRLVCIDEVHMLCEERGSVLEVIVSRMKTLGTRIRFIALSATVPNIHDVAEWLGDGGLAGKTKDTDSSEGHADTFVFGEEYRPIKLSKFVYGVARKKDQTEYQFMSILNFKLMEMIISHSSGKPTLIFCGTRKSSLQAAETISKAYEKLVENTPGKLPWKVAKSSKKISDKKLASLVSQGIGIHHAGLDWQDRKYVEELFRENIIKVLCTTSTLAVGVNLPARSVIIRGTRTYKGGSASGTDGFENYSDLDLIQMMGRAGRPQFDTEGVAVIMTAQNDKARIDDLVNSKTLLESCLHLNLTEHINSEVNIGTITSHASALRWIHNSFLSIRIRKNPKNYSIGGAAELPGDRQLEIFVDNALDLLAQDNLIEQHDGEIHPTDLGEIMSRHCLRHKTFLILVSLKPNSTTRSQLEAISNSEEFSTIRFRAGEITAYTKLNTNVELKFSLAGKISQSYQKVMLLIQAILGGIPLVELKTDNNNPQMESNMVWQHLPRICKCLVALTIAKRDVGAKSGLELLRSVNAKAWEGSPWVLRQLDQIGEKSVKRMAESNICTIDQVRKTDASRIEMILDRNPPFGTKIVKQAISMPKFECTMNRISEEVTSEGIHVCVEIEVGLSDTNSTVNWKWRNTLLMATVLVLTSDHQWIEFRTIQVKLLSNPKRFTVECILIKPSQNLVTHIACQQIAGIGCTMRWSPTTPRQHYPTPKAINADDAAASDVLAGINAEDLDSSSDEIVIEKHISRHEPKKTETRLKKPQDSTCAQTKKDNVPVCKGIILSKTTSNQLDAGARLENGRYKCAHKCKGTCHHSCCINGMAKPPQTRKKDNANNGSTRSQESATHPDPSFTFKHPGNSSSPKITNAGGVKAGNQHFDYGGDLPELQDIFITDEPANDRAERPGLRHERAHSSQAFSDPDIDNMILEDQDFLDRLDRSLGNDGPAGGSGNGSFNTRTAQLPKTFEEQHINSSSVSKFLNTKKTVNEFDERAIFKQLKNKNDAKGKKKVVEKSLNHHLSDFEDTRPQKDVPIAPSLSPEIASIPRNDKKRKADGSGVEGSKTVDDVVADKFPVPDEVDELDDDYDLSIFEPYIVREEELGHSAAPKVPESHPEQNAPVYAFKRAKIYADQETSPSRGSSSALMRKISSTHLPETEQLPIATGFSENEEDEIDELEDELAWVQEYLPT